MIGQAAIDFSTLFLPKDRNIDLAGNEIVPSEQTV